MAYTAFHRKLAALYTASASSTETVIQAIGASQTSLTTTVNQRVDALDIKIDGVDEVVQLRTGSILDAIRIIRPPDLVLTEAVRDVLSGLAQVEVLTLDKTPDLEENNQALHKQTTGRRMTERAKLLEGSDATLPQDYRAAFQPFARGDDAERAARLQAVMNLRDRVLRHFAAQHTADATN